MAAHQICLLFFTNILVIKNVVFAIFFKNLDDLDDAGQKRM
jgi:hypothetical protein